jgi:catechol 2,3-dioxygenase-like lactoylglutathione lyase family enzyme
MRWRSQQQASLHRLLHQQDGSSPPAEHRHGGVHFCLERHLHGEVRDLCRSTEVPMRPIDRVLETILYVDDLAAAERFYGEVLGLELDSRKDGLFVFFKCGNGMLLLFEPAAASTGRNVPAHGAHGPGHVCFAIAEAALDGWRQRLEAEGIAIEQEMTWPRGGRSFYFRDPAGNSLELATPRIWGLPEVAASG